MIVAAKRQCEKTRYGESTGRWQFKRKVQEHNDASIQGSLNGFFSLSTDTTYERFWTNVIDRLHCHRQTTRWGNIFEEDLKNLCRDFCCSNNKQFMLPFPCICHPSDSLCVHWSSKEELSWKVQSETGNEVVDSSGLPFPSCRGGQDTRSQAKPSRLKGCDGINETQW